MKPDDITAGESWACKFRITTYLNSDGTPASLDSLPTNPETLRTGSWVSMGVIAKRDSKNRLLEIIDTATDRTWILNYEDVWDIDRAEFTKDSEHD